MPPPKSPPAAANEVLAHAREIARLYERHGAEIGGGAGDLAKIVAAAYLALARHGIAGLAPFLERAEDSLRVDHKRAVRAGHEAIRTVVASTLDGPRDVMVKRVVQALSVHPRLVRASVVAGKWPGDPAWPAAGDAPIAKRIHSILIAVVDSADYRGDAPVAARAEIATERLLRRLGIETGRTGRKK